jgi:hypothetical protein
VRTSNPVAPPSRAIPRTAVFATPDEISVGTVVFDHAYDMPGKVRKVDGRYVELERPTGFAWRVPFLRLRRGTEREARQLEAIGRLHALRQRGRS